MIREREKPPFRSSAWTSLLLFGFAFVMATLHFWYSVATSIILAILWGVLAVQKYLRHKFQRSSITVWSREPV